MAQQSGSGGGALSDLVERGRLVWRLLNDDRVPNWLKLVVPLVVLLYLVSPIDLIPDFLIGLGQLDDIGVVLLGMALFIRLAPQVVVDEHRRALGMATTDKPGGEPTRRVSSDEVPIEGEYRVANDPNKNVAGYKENREG